MQEQPIKLYLRLDAPEAYQPIIQSIGDELLVYDPIQAKAHNLSQTAAKIYQACEEGKWNQKALEAEFGREVVMNTLLELSKAGLIVWNPPTKLGRRKFLAAAALVPVISSITVPSPAAAASASCGTTGGSEACFRLNLHTGGGATGQGPLGSCISCCGPGPELAFCDNCPGNCNVCNCLSPYVCSDDGSTLTPCNTTTNTLDICQVGSTDFPGYSPPRVVAIPSCQRPSIIGRARAFSCAEARAEAVLLGQSIYTCCTCT
jgi:hypothetical protein